MPTDRLGKPTSVRLENGIGELLARMASKHRISPAVLIRDAIAAKLPEWESAGVRLTIREPQKATS